MPRGPCPGPAVPWWVRRCTLLCSAPGPARRAHPDEDPDQQVVRGGAPGPLGLRGRRAGAAAAQRGRGALSPGLPPALQPLLLVWVAPTALLALFRRGSTQESDSRARGGTFCSDSTANSRQPDEEQTRLPWNDGIVNGDGFFPSQNLLGSHAAGQGCVWLCKTTNCTLPFIYI